LSAKDIALSDHLPHMIEVEYHTLDKPAQLDYLRTFIQDFNESIFTNLQLDSAQIF